MFRVDPKTVTRWAAAGKLGSVRTPGGHRRFRESEVRALLEGSLEPKPSLEEQERQASISEQKFTGGQLVDTEVHPVPELSNGYLNVLRANHDNNMGGRS